MKKLASAIFLLDSVVIGLGAFGHGSQARHLHAAIDQFPIESDMHSMIYVVWYFVSGCMLAFGATLIWAWQRLRAGDRGPLVAAILIGVLYTGIGVFGLVHRHGDPFMAFFVVLAVCSWSPDTPWLRAGTPTRADTGEEVDAHLAASKLQLRTLRGRPDSPPR